MEDLTEYGRLADVNLAESWTALGAITGAAGGSDRCTFVATGIPVAFFNGAYVSGRVDDPERVVADAIRFMADHDVPWLLWVREGVDDALLDAGRQAGLTDAGGPPAMVLPTISTDTPLEDAPAIEPVYDASGVETFRDLMARGFEMPAEVARAMISEQLLHDPSIGMLIGVVGDEPVSCSLVSVTGTTAGIYNVATPPEHRRRGYGSALTRAAIEEGARRGCDHAILQASDLGAPIYRRMGFLDVGRYVQLEGPPGDTTSP